MMQKYVQAYRSSAQALIDSGMAEGHDGVVRQYGVQTQVVNTKSLVFVKPSILSFEVNPPFIASVSMVAEADAIADAESKSNTFDSLRSFCFRDILS